MRVFKTKWFGRFARRQRISDAMLCDAVHRAERGLVDADLGGGLIKQRVARPGEGRSGGYRTLLFFRSGTRAVFAFGWSKSARPNIDEREADILKRTAAEALAFSNDAVDRLIAAAEWTEVDCDDTIRETRSLQ